MEVFPGVHQLKVPIDQNALGYLNSYLIQGDKGCLLVDTGWNSRGAFQSLKEQLDGLGLTLRDIARVVITHVHPDHYGLAGLIKQASPTRFAFHLWEKALIEERYIEFAQLQNKMGKFLCRHGVPRQQAGPLEIASMPALDFVTVAWPDEVLYGGEIISIGDFQLEVLWTPGHSPGHVCLYEPSKKLLFSGDHVLPGITPNVSYNLQSGSNPLGDFINSLNQLRRLPVDLVLPAHEHIFEGLEDRIQQIVGHHEDRKGEILSTLSEEPLSAFLIARQLSWHIRDDWDHLDAYHQRSAMTETLAHLEMMRMEGRVERHSRDGVIRYELATLTGS